MPILIGPHVISVFTRLKLPFRYATDNGIEKIVTVKMGGPGPEQTWWIQPVPVEGRKDVYTITIGEAPPNLGTPGFHREIGRRPDDVINSPLRGEWYLVPVKDELEVFEVHPVDRIVGVDELLATEGDNVVVKTYPIVFPEPPIETEKPAWRFTPILKD